MFNLDGITNVNNREHNKKIAIHSRSPLQNFDNWWFWIRKNKLLKEQGDINKIYLYAKQLREPKYQFSIKRRKDAGIKRLNDSNVFIY